MTECLGLADELRLILPTHPSTQTVEEPVNIRQEEISLNFKVFIFKSGLDQS